MKISLTNVIDERKENMISLNKKKKHFKESRMRRRDTSLAKIKKKRQGAKLKNKNKINKKKTPNVIDFPISSPFILCFYNIHALLISRCLNPYNPPLIDVFIIYRPFLFPFK